MIKCISLLSGGLDSILATRLMLEQNLEVEALTMIHDVHPRHEGEDTPARRAARRLEVPLIEVYEPDRFIAMLKNPKYGYGKNLNPCIDCRILLLGVAKERMDERGALFVVTGEVVGERPMSQRRDTMRLIEKQSGLEGLILRPLSAKLLEPTIPEQRGWVDRDKLYDIKGRSRKPQMELAAKLGITEYPTPAGGCLLTDPGFSARLREMMVHEPEFGANDIQLLRVGRHFRLPGGARAVVGRNQEENDEILSLAQATDLLLDAVDIPGPTTLVRGPVPATDVTTAAALTAKYGKARSAAHANVEVRRCGEDAQQVVTVAPADDMVTAALHIG